MSEEQREQALILRELGSDVITVDEIAARLGVHERTIYKWYEKPKVTAIELTDDGPWTLSGDWCIAGDFHVDACDWAYVLVLIDTCKEYGIKKLCIAGDIFSFSNNSRHSKVFQEASIVEELKLARRLLALLFTYFEEIRFFIGNHDERLIEALNGDFTMQDIGYAICPPNKGNQFYVSDSNFCWLQSGDQKWLIAHAYMYGPPLKVSRELAHRWRCNVLQQHQHISAEGLSIDRQFNVVDGGCMCNSGAINYKAKRIQKFPEFNIGFTLIINGKHKRFYKVGE